MLMDKFVSCDTNPNFLSADKLDFNQSKRSIRHPVQGGVGREVSGGRHQVTREHISLCITSSKKSVFDSQCANPRGLDPTRECFDVSLTRNADAPRTGITTVDSQSTAGGVKAGAQVKPQIISPGFGTTQAVITGGQRCRITGTPAPVCGLSFSDAAGRWPAGQQSTTTMQLNLPDSVAIWKPFSCSTGTELQCPAL